MHGAGRGQRCCRLGGLVARWRCCLLHCSSPPALHDSVATTVREGGGASNAHDLPQAAPSSSCAAAVRVQVAMGFGHSLFLVKEGDAKAASAPVWEPPCDRDEAAPTVGGTKRKAPAGGAKGSGKGKKK